MPDGVIALYCYIGRIFRNHGNIPALARDASGSVLTVAALAFPVLIGGMGLGAEVGHWYLKQRKLQHAADVAAVSAATRLKEGDDQSVLDAVALHIATETGFSGSAGSIEVNNPPSSGPNAGVNRMVEVILTEDLERSLTKLFTSDAVRIRGRGVAEVVQQNICVLALHASANSALSVKGSASASFSGCDAASNSTSNSSVDLQGSGSLSVDCINAVGGYQQGNGSHLTLNKCSAVDTNSRPTADPYSDLIVPTAPTACIPGNIGANNTYTTVVPTLTLANGVSYMRFCSLSLQGHVTFSPGLYIVDGAMSSTGQTIAGDGVTFVVGANVNLAGNVVLDLSAPASGPHSGLLFFGDRNADIESNKITGSTGSVLQGAVYFPTGDLEYTGSSAASNGCTQLIANKVAFDGSSSVHSSCANAGTRALSKGVAVALVE